MAEPTANTGEENAPAPTAPAAAPASTAPVAAPSAAGSNADVVTTVCVMGFPRDFTGREFRNMFIFAEGFKDSLLRSTERGFLGFALFEFREQADAVVNVLNGGEIDVENGTKLKASIANSQLRKTSTKILSAPSAKAYMAGGGVAGGGYTGGMGMMGAHMPPFHSAAVQQQHQRPMGITTLHLTFSSSEITEGDVQSALSTLYGFQFMKFIPRPPTHCITFVKFSSPPEAESALQTLQDKDLVLQNGVSCKVTASYANKEMRM